MIPLCELFLTIERADEMLSLQSISDFMYILYRVQSENRNLNMKCLITKELDIKIYSKLR